MGANDAVKRFEKSRKPTPRPPVSPHLLKMNDVKSKKNKTLTGLVVGLASSMSDAWRALVLLALMIVSPIIDIASGSMAIMLMSNYDTSMLFIGEGTLAMALSIFTSGIQVLLTIIFTGGGKKKFKIWQLVILIYIMVIDTILDMTIPFFIFYREAPLEIVLSGKPILFYAVTLIFGTACLLSEQILFMVSRINKK